jgi:hypothetical protein
MTDSVELERRYRRLLRCYPPAFRRAHEEEILAVLLDGARDGQRRPATLESADLLGSAVGMRVRPGAPRSVRTVFVAVRLMYIGAALELITLITILETLGNVRSQMLRRNPSLSTGQWHAFVSAQIVPLIIGAGIALVVWVWMAWAAGHGRRWARGAFALFVALTATSLLSGIAKGSAIYAPQDLIAGTVLFLVALAALLLVFSKPSAGYFSGKPA